MVCLQTCASNGFCKRNRGAKFFYIVVPGSVSASGAELSAHLLDKASDVQFNLTLKAYGPILRLIVDEMPSDKHAARYQIPDIIMPAAEQALTPWDSSHAAAKEWTGRVAGTSVKLTYNPFKLEISVDNKPAVVFNSRNMFTIEYPREKKVLVPFDDCCATSLPGKKQQAHNRLTWINILQNQHVEWMRNIPLLSTHVSPPQPVNLLPVHVQPSRVHNTASL